METGLSLFSFAALFTTFIPQVSGPPTFVTCLGPASSLVCLLVAYALLRMSLPRVTSRTPLAVVPEFAFADSKSPTSSYPPSSSALLPTSMSSQLSSHPHIAALIAAFHPRKPKQRTTFAALILLVCLTTYIFIAHSSVSPALALRKARAGDARGTTSEQLALALETIQNARLKEAARLKSLAASSTTSSSSKSSHAADAQELTMSPSEELAAITFFLASLPQNVIPHTVDPKKPIDPQLVLDFDTRGAKAKEELDALVEDVWSRNPVFLWSKVSWCFGGWVTRCTMLVIHPDVVLSSVTLPSASSLSLYNS